MFNVQKFKSAVLKGDAEKVRELLTQGVDPNTRIDRYTDPLENAVRCCNMQMLGVLLADERTKWSSGAFRAAAFCQNTARLEALIKRFPDKINAPLYTGGRALDVAAAKGCLAVVKLLLENGADPNLRGSDNRTPLYHAQQAGRDDVVALLKPLTLTPEQCAGVQPLRQDGDAGWQKTDDARVVIVTDFPVLGYRITDIYDFSGRERLRIVFNHATGKDQPETCVFDELNDNDALEAARQAFVAQGGDPALAQRRRALPKQRLTAHGG